MRNDTHSSYDTSALKLKSSSLVDGFGGMFESDSKLVWVNAGDVGKKRGFYDDDLYRA